MDSSLVTHHPSPLLEASPFWQNAFLVGLFVALGWCVYSGWRVGVVRATMSLVGMCLGGVVGLVAGVFAAAIFSVATPVYGGVLGLLVGAAIGLVTYAVASIVAALIFKRTSQQPTSALRLGYGIGGGLIGVFVGVSVVWGALLFVRGIGGFCQATVEGDGHFYGLMLPKPAARAVVKLKRSVEAGRTGRFLESLDVMPAEFYRIMDKFGRLAASPEAARRFIAYPGIEDVLADMHFIELTDDPEIRDITRSDNPSGLIANRKVIEAAKDPGLIAKLQKIDIEKALDYALAPPEPAKEPQAMHHPSTP